jgi:hypothetical protein
MDINLRFLPPIPDGMRIIEGDVEVAGVNHRVDNALAFAQRQTNALNSNARRIIQKTRTRLKSSVFRQPLTVRGPG